MWRHQQIGLWHPWGALGAYVRSQAQSNGRVLALRIRLAKPSL